MIGLPKNFSRNPSKRETNIPRIQERELQHLLAIAFAKDGYKPIALTGRQLELYR